MSLKIIRGDLLDLAAEGRFDVIAHGSNCFCTMGSGVAGQIKKRFPAAYEADLATRRGDQSKLGICSSATVELAGGNKLVILNAYTQYRYGTDRQHADYAAIRSCMRSIKKQYFGSRIGLPRIGAGLAGGDWNVIVKIIEEELAGEDAALVEFSGAS